MTSFRLLFALTIVAILQALYAYPRLPDTVPYHFNFQGQPDAWGSKTFMVGIDVGVTLFLMLSFLGTALIIPRVGDAYINVPNKEYWLAPERRDTALRMIIDLLGWIGVLTLLFLQFVMMQTYRVAMEESLPNLSGIWPVLGVYLLLIGFVVVRYIMKFRLPPGIKK